MDSGFQGRCERDRSARAFDAGINGSAGNECVGTPIKLPV